MHYPWDWEEEGQVGLREAAGSLVRALLPDLASRLEQVPSEETILEINQIVEPLLKGKWALLVGDANRKVHVMAAAAAATFCWTQALARQNYFFEMTTTAKLVQLFDARRLFDEEVDFGDSPGVVINRMERVGLLVWERVIEKYKGSEKSAARFSELLAIRQEKQLPVLLTAFGLWEKTERQKKVFDLIAQVLGEGASTIVSEEAEFMAMGKTEEEDARTGPVEKYGLK